MTTRLPASTFLVALTVLLSACQDAAPPQSSSAPSASSPEPVKTAEVRAFDSDGSFGSKDSEPEYPASGEAPSPPDGSSVPLVDGRDLEERLERLRPRVGAQPGPAATRARELFTGRLWAVQTQAGAVDVEIPKAAWEAAVQVYGEAVRSEPFYAAELLGDEQVPSEVRGELVKAYVEQSLSTGLDGVAARIRLIQEKDTSDSAAWILAEQMSQGMSEAELAKVLARADLFGPSMAQQVASSIFQKRNRQP